MCLYGYQISITKLMKLDSLKLCSVCAAVLFKHLWNSNWPVRPIRRLCTETGFNSCRTSSSRLENSLYTCTLAAMAFFPTYLTVCRSEKWQWERASSTQRTPPVWSSSSAAATSSTGGSAGKPGKCGDHWSPRSHGQTTRKGENC